MISQCALRTENSVCDLAVCVCVSPSVCFGCVCVCMSPSVCDFHIEGYSDQGHTGEEVDYALIQLLNSFFSTIAVNVGYWTFVLNPLCFINHTDN